MAYRKKTHEEFASEVRAQVGDEYTVIGEYVNTDTRIRMRHNSETCGNHEYDVVAFKFTARKQRCPHPNCRWPRQLEKWKEAVPLDNFLKPAKTNEQFLKEVQELVGNEYTFLEPYKTCKTKLKVRHNAKDCGHVYTVAPVSFTSDGRRCPRCARLAIGRRLDSRPVKAIKEWLSANGYEYACEVCFDELRNSYGKMLYFDFQIALHTGENILLEYDGIQHVKGWMGNPDKLPDIRGNDSLKDEFCQYNNIKLLRLTHKDDKRITARLRELIDHIEGSTTSP